MLLYSFHISKLLIRARKIKVNKSSFKCSGKKSSNAVNTARRIKTRTMQGLRLYWLLVEACSRMVHEINPVETTKGRVIFPLFLLLIPFKIRAATAKCENKYSDFLFVRGLFSFLVKLHRPSFEKRP